MLDRTDVAILKLLQQNSRMQWREIGEQVHLTGQAVGHRIRKMEEQGIIEGFTIQVNNAKLGASVTAHVTIFMKANDHAAFQAFVKQREEISEVHRISGEGCYVLKVNVASSDELNQLLDDILHYANYRVNISLGKVK